MRPFELAAIDANTIAPASVATTSRIYTGGSSDRVDVGTWSVVSSTFTMCCWVYLSTINYPRDDRFIAKADGTGVANHDWMIGMSNVDTGYFLRCRINRQSNTTFGSTQLNIGSSETPAFGWFHALLTYDNGSVTLYLNGTSDGTGTHGSGNLPNNTNSILIGNQPTALTSAPNGRIAKVGIWSSVLSSGDIATISASGVAANAVDPASVSPGTLVGAWVLGAGSPEPDSSGNGRSGTVTGTTIGAFP